MRGKSLLMAGVFAASVAFAAPAPAMAQSYQAQYAAQDPACQGQKQKRMLLGGVIGAVAGAVLGNNVAARNAQPEGSLLGGALGAATGAAIGNATTQCGPYPASGSGQFHPRSNVGTSQYPQQPGYYPPQGGQQPYGQPPYDDYGLAGGPYQPSSYGRSDCRWGEQTLRDPYGRETRQDVYMCRGADGVWRAQS